MAENRFDELFRQGFVEGICVPAAIMVVSTLGILAIGERDQLDPQSLVQLIGRISVITTVIGCMTGCVVGGRLKMNLGRSLKALYPEANPHTTIEATFNDQ